MACGQESVLGVAGAVVATAPNTGSISNSLGVAKSFVTESRKTKNLKPFLHISSFYLFHRYSLHLQKSNPYFKKKEVNNWIKCGKERIISAT